MEKKHWIFLIIFFIAGIWSGINPYETGLWFLEAGMCIVGVAILAFTFKRFRFTDMTYVLSYHSFCRGALFLC